MLLSHANALVGNLNLNICEAHLQRTVLDNLYVDLASFPWKLDGVGNQVDENLHHALHIQHEFVILQSLGIVVQIYLFQQGLALHHFDNLGNQSVQTCRFKVWHQFPFF